jgi:protein-S-isoprenylcysteine O-methyltransferase Ste14
MLRLRSHAIVAAQLVLMTAIVLPWRAAGWNAGGSALAVVAIALGAWTLRANRIGNFNIRPEPKRGARLVTDGPYRFVRHPMYLAVLIGTAGFALGYADTDALRDVDVARAALWVALAAVLHAKTLIEERELRALYPQYAAYARRAKRILPFLF